MFSEFPNKKEWKKSFKFSFQKKIQHHKSWKKNQYILHWFVSFKKKSNLNSIQFKLRAISFNIFTRMKINLHKMNLPFPFINCHCKMNLPFPFINCHCKMNLPFPFINCHCKMNFYLFHSSIVIAKWIYLFRSSIVIGSV